MRFTAAGIRQQDKAAFDAWLETMTRQYDLRSCQKFPVWDNGTKEQGLVEAGCVEVYELRRRGPGWPSAARDEKAGQPGGSAARAANWRDRDRFRRTPCRELPAAVACLGRRVTIPRVPLF